MVSKHLTNLIICRIESKANLLWIPLESEYNSNTDWLEKNFEKDTRDELVVFESGNVLTPESLKQVIFSPSFNRS